MFKQTRKIGVLCFPKQGESNCRSGRISIMLNAALQPFSDWEVEYLSLSSLPYEGKIILAVHCDEIGGNENLYAWLRSLYAYQKSTGKSPLRNCTAAIVIESDGPYFTKRLAQYTLFHMNEMGCRFIGHPMVEAVDALQNFSTWQKIMDHSLEEILALKCTKLGQRLKGFELPVIDNPKILVLHSSSPNTSNTLKLWELVSEHLSGFEIKEFKIEDDQIAECKGCSFKTCMHFSEMKSCYYGGMMVDDILPAMEWADAIIWVCPNYNDAISAKLMAVINRMTVLYRRMTFYEKRVFGIIVSGNSGSDLVITQLLGGVSINKGFMLPPHFSLSAIANDPLSIVHVEGIQEKAMDFAQNIMSEFGFKN